MTKEPEEGANTSKPIWTEAHKICKHLQEGSVSSAELMENIYARIESINPQVNAIVNLLPREEALSLAKESDKVPPFDLSDEWVKEINGEKLETYIDWMSVCCMISATGLPAISIPRGFTTENLPAGIQLVGKPRGDIELLKIAHLFESETNFYKNKPSL